MAFATQILLLGKFQAHYLPKFIKLMESKDRDNITISSPALRKELRWWTLEENLRQRAIIRDAPPDTQIFSDASNFGFGAHNCSGICIQGKWTRDHKSLHINAKELQVGTLALESHLAPLGSSVSLFLDNKAAYFVIKNKGSNSSSSIQALSKRFLNSVMKKDLAVYLQGSRNVSADALSRDKAIPTEWSLTPRCFQDLLKQIECTPQVDLMATP